MTIQLKILSKDNTCRHGLSDASFMLSDASFMPINSKVRSLYSEHVETDLCAACHAFATHVRAWGKMKRLRVFVD